MEEWMDLAWQINKSINGGKEGFVRQKAIDWKRREDMKML